MVTQLDLPLPSSPLLGFIATGATLSDLPSNTGSDSQACAYQGLELGIDAITLLWSGDSNILEVTNALANIIFDFTTSTERKIGILWNRCYRGTLGCLYMQRDTADGMCHRLSLSGGALSLLPVPLIHRWMQSVRETESLRCSRIDIRCDDYGDRIRYTDVLAALEAGNFSGFISATCIRNFGSDGWTFNLGSRESEHYMRIYNKEAESNGDMKCRRVESEFKGDKAAYIFDAIAAYDSCGAGLLGSWLLGKFDFVVKAEKNLDRCKRLEWYQQFVDELATIPQVAIVERVKSSVERKMLWIRKQVSKSLALIRRATGEAGYDDYIEEVLLYGRSKMRRFEDILCAEYLTCHNMDVPI